MTEHFKKFFSLGFFPEELPPEFGPYGITDEVAEDLWGRINEIRPLNGTPSYQTHISYPKSEYIRREFHFLNPKYFARVCHTILSNWDEIIRHTNRSEISTSRLKLSSSANQIFEHDPFSTSVNERIKRSAAKEYVLYLDIENFYSSIYTHTIDWALNDGNKRSHQEFNNREHIGVALDQDIRRSQHNETSGIVIGPVTSRIISEIIASHFDNVLKSNFDKLSGTRYVDDYHVFLNSKEEVDKVQIVLQKALSAFKLKFNEAKIYIDKLPEVYSDFWTTHFEKTESLLKDEVGDKRELTRRFSKAFKLIKETPDNPSLRYFFRVLEDDAVLSHFEISTVMNLISHSLRIDPRCISRACITLSKSGLVNDEIHDHIECLEAPLIKKSNLGYSFEVLWILYLFLHAQRQIPNQAIQNIISNCDVTCVAYLFVCWRSGIVTNDQIQEVREMLMTKVEEYGNIWLSPLWLIAYEDKRQGWNVFDSEMPDDFKIFKDRQIEFLTGEPNDDPNDIRISRYNRDIEEEIGETD